MKNKKKYLFVLAAIILVLLLTNAVCLAADGSATNEFWSKMYEKLHNNFIKDNRWKYLTTGLGTTLIISFFAVIVGIVLGFIIAILSKNF